MRKFLISVLLFFGCILMYAQEITVDKEAVKKKEINNIKLTERAVYAEVVELAADDEEAITLAQQKTINKLQTNVIEACAQKMNMSTAGVKEIFDIIDDKCQNVVIKKGDMVRVFAYIAKDAIGLGRRKPKQKDLDEIFGPEPEEESDSVAIQNAINKAMGQVMGKQEVINQTPTQLPQNMYDENTSKQVAQAVQQASSVQTVPQAQTVVVVQQQPQTTSVATVAQPSQTIVVVQQPTTTATTVVANSTPVQPVVSQPKAEPVREVQQAPIVVPALCQTMMDKGNMDNLMVYLKQEKNYHHLMFGNSKSMQYPNKCYIVLLDKATKKIVSVLDKGETERMNFVTKKMDRFSNYRGGNYAAIFVQEY